MAETTTTGATAPPALRGPLVFGDQSQIQALKELPQPPEGMENLTRYRVTIEVSGEAEVEVWATDPENAKELARDEFYIGDLDDIDIEARYARVV